jgi:hypothetical protein
LIDPPCLWSGIHTAQQDHNIVPSVAVSEAQSASLSLSENRKYLRSDNKTDSFSGEEATKKTTMTLSIVIIHVYNSFPVSKFRVEFGRVNATFRKQIVNFNYVNRVSVAQVLYGWS